MEKQDIIMLIAVLILVIMAIYGVSIPILTALNG